MKSRSRPGQAASTDAQRNGTTPELRVDYLMQAIAYVAEGRGDLVPEWYLHFIAGMVDGALSRRRPRVA
jgi:hypothetical protein